MSLNNVETMHASSLQLKYYKFVSEKIQKIVDKNLSNYSSSKISIIVHAAFATGLPGPKIAATPAL